MGGTNGFASSTQFSPPHDVVCRWGGGGGLTGKARHLVCCYPGVVSRLTVRVEFGVTERGNVVEVPLPVLIGGVVLIALIDNLLLSAWIFDHIGFGGCGCGWWGIRHASLRDYRR